MDIVSQREALHTVGGLASATARGRRRRIEFLLRILDAPIGVRRPHKQVVTELEQLLALEWAY